MFFYKSALHWHWRASSFYYDFFILPWHDTAPPSFCFFFWLLLHEWLQYVRSKCYSTWKKSSVWSRLCFYLLIQIVWLVFQCLVPGSEESLRSTADAEQKSNRSLWRPTVWLQTVNKCQYLSDKQTNASLWFKLAQWPTTLFMDVNNAFYPHCWSLKTTMDLDHCVNYSELSCTSVALMSIKSRTWAALPSGVTFSLPSTIKPIPQLPPCLDSLLVCGDPEVLHHLPVPACGRGAGPLAAESGKFVKVTGPQVPPCVWGRNPQHGPGEMNGNKQTVKIGEWLVMLPYSNKVTGLISVCSLHVQPLLVLSRFKPGCEC